MTGTRRRQIGGIIFRPMIRRITAFHQDDESHWVAELECGHSQHVRHDPPWQVREWVLTEESRRTRLGTALDCVRCDEEVPSDLTPAESAAYHDARLRGLCQDGAREAARNQPSSRPESRTQNR